jgi:hypothetical protein
MLREIALDDRGSLVIPHNEDAVHPADDLRLPVASEIPNAADQSPNGAKVRKGADDPPDRQVLVEDNDLSLRSLDEYLWRRIAVEIDGADRRRADRQQHGRKNRSFTTQGLHGPRGFVVGVTDAMHSRTPRDEYLILAVAIEVREREVASPGKPRHLFLPYEGTVARIEAE